MTLRSLLRMVQSRKRFEWGQTACIIAKIHNVNCENNRDMITAEDVMPNGAKFKQSAPPPTESDRVALRLAFPGKRA